MNNLVDLLHEEINNTIEENVTTLLLQEDIYRRQLEVHWNILNNLITELEDGLSSDEDEDGPARIKNYYEEVIPRYSNEEFFSHFRMSRKVFKKLVDAIKTYLPWENTGMPLKKKIYITVWILATPDSIRSVDDRFDVAKSTAHLAMTEILVILRHLLPLYVKWPDQNELDDIEAGFLQRSGFPGVVGAIDGCHIEIRQPPGNANDYYNRKGVHSIVLQGVCDHRRRFIDLLISGPGRAHDAGIFRTSCLYRKLTDNNNPLLPPDRHLLGDSGYPLLTNVLTPFRDNGFLAIEQTRYNIKHASTRSVIERAFGLLKNKFRRLYYLDVQSIEMANAMVAAACVLHNFIIIHSANVQQVVDITDDDDDGDDDNNSDSDDELIDDENAIDKRNNIMERL